MSAKPAPLIDQRPKCAVRGLIQPRAMCSMVIVGGTYCGHSGPCQHKIEPDATRKAGASDKGETEC